MIVCATAIGKLKFYYSHGARELELFYLFVDLTSGFQVFSFGPRLVLLIRTFLKQVLRVALGDEVPVLLEMN